MKLFFAITIFTAIIATVHSYGDNKISNCYQRVKDLGYKCCKEPCDVIYTDVDGDWGAENNEWCGCGGEDFEISKDCPESIIRIGYVCCDHCQSNYEDEFGKWYHTNNHDWCALKPSCNNY